MDYLSKYDQPVPRYTSYPTVPYWQPAPPTPERWLGSLNARLAQDDAISLYVHLPFCEQLCTYCGCHKRITKNHAVEEPYVDAVLAELRLYLQAFTRLPRLKELHLGGGTPTFFSPATLGRLVDGILAELPVADDHSFAFEAHPASTTAGHLQVLADRGFRRLSIGVQDFNPEIMQLINRRQTEEEVARTVCEAHLAGYTSVNFDLIYGLPRQTLADIDYTINKVREMAPDRIAFYGYAHVPWHSPGQRAYSEDDLPRGRERWQLYRSGRRQLLDAGYYDIGLDHFALPADDLATAHRDGKLHRNFMGYTTANTPVTLALGCSAIGDSWDTFVQNEKKVEAYQRTVLLEGRLPIVKGHALSPTDQTIRRHILNLMCRGYTDWHDEALRCTAIDRAVLYWNDMAIDGLVRRSPYRVEVTEAGQAYLRNICLPLDDHYWARNPTAATFSQAI